MFQRYFVIARSIHRTCPHLVKKKPTPGAGHQLEALESAEEYINDPEAFGDFESDFMQVNKSYRQHESELEEKREQVRHMMVKRKYFKEPQLPNLLLYAEKEEIRSLYASDSDEWTIEKLAESFPATPDIIKKIVDKKWRPYSIKRIRTHDEAVIKNWERLRNGETNDMNIPEDLREHVIKFAKRTLNNATIDESKNSDLIPKLQKPKHNEFSSIITSCKKYADNADEKKKSIDMVTIKSKRNLKPDIDPSDETYLIEKVKDKRKMRLQELQEIYSLKTEIKTSITAENTEEYKDESLLVPKYDNPIGTGFIRKFESNEIVVSPEDSKKYEITKYKDQIHIPRKLWRKGSTYRVEDCYYDDDGEFLYRVPGMSGINQT